MIPARRAALCAVAATLLPAAAWACRCAEPVSAATAYRQAYAVVQATVRHVDGDPYGPGGATAVLSPSKAWKQGVKSDLEVRTSSTCAFEFRTGEEYLLYLQRSAKTGGLTTHMCMGNVEAARAQKSMDWLGRHGSAADVAR